MRKSLPESNGERVGLHVPQRQLEMTEDAAARKLTSS